MVGVEEQNCYPCFHAKISHDEWVKNVMNSLGDADIKPGVTIHEPVELYSRCGTTWTHHAGFMNN